MFIGFFYSLNVWNNWLHSGLEERRTN